MSAKKVPNPKDELLEMLDSKYRSEPEKFRSYLPEVAQALDSLNPPRRPGRSPFGLTERERRHHQQALKQIVEVEGAESVEQAVKALEHCVALIQDDSLPEEVKYKTLVKLFRAAVGRPLSSFKALETIAVADNRSPADAVTKVSLVRGVSLDLDQEMRLVSITVLPSKVRQRRKLLAFVGIGQDAKSDVALRHDEYLAEQDPHASS